MTGKEHYEEADRLLDEAYSNLYGTDAKQAIARAQVHATLSLVQAQLAIATTNIPSHEADNIWLNWGERLKP